MRTPKRLTGLVAIAAASLLVAGACSSKANNSGTTQQQNSFGYSECPSKPDTCNSGPRKQGGTIIAALGKKIQNFNIDASDGNLVESVEVMNAILPGAYTFLPSGKIAWNPDLFTEEPKVTNTSPQTVVYKIRPEAKWDDGTAINVDDFVYNWKLQDGHDKNILVAGTTGYDDITGVVGSDNGQTVTVTFKDPYSDWRGLFGSLYPAHIGAKAGDIKTDTGLEAAFKDMYKQPTWTGGAFKITAYDKATHVELVPNPAWYGRDKPTLDKIVYQFITDPKQQLPALQNKEINALNVQPSKDLYDGLKALNGVLYSITAGYSWEHIDLNTKNKWLADLALRTAIFDTISRQDIIDKTFKSYFPSAKPLGSHNFVSSANGYKDILSQVAPDQGNGKVDAAKKVLTDAGYTIVNGQLKDKTGANVGPLSFVHTGTTARAATSEVVVQELKQIGLTITDKITDDLSTTLQTEAFDMILFGWGASPLLSPNADLWKTGGGNNFTQWGDASSDKLLADMTKELDLNKQIQMLNDQDVILTKAAVVMPITDKPNAMAVSDTYVNIRDNTAGSYFTYNTQSWGVKQS